MEGLEDKVDKILSTVTDGQIQLAVMGEKISTIAENEKELEKRVAKGEEWEKCHEVEHGKSSNIKVTLWAVGLILAMVGTIITIYTKIGA